MSADRPFRNVAIISHVEDNRFLLLEKLAADVLSICAGHEEVQYARVSVDKPHALRFADSVAVSLSFSADDERGGGHKK